MKNIIYGIIWGRNNKINGLSALLMVSLIVLGCTCGKDFKFGENRNTGSNTSTSNKDDSPFSKNLPFSKNSNSSGNQSDNSDNDETTDKDDTNEPKADASKKQIPGDSEMQDIVRTTLLDFNEAVQSEDFTTFHSNVSKTLQRQATPQQIKDKFQMFIDGQMNISSISSLNATFTSPPKLISNRLDVKGEYPTPGLKTTFELQYIPEGKEWKLIQIKIVAPIKRRQ